MTATMITEHRQAARGTLRDILTGLAALVFLGSSPAHAQQQDSSVGIRLLAFNRVGAETAVTVLTPGNDKPLTDKPLALPTQQLSSRAVVPTRTLVFASPDDPLRI